MSSPQGKQELESRLKKQEKAQRPPIIWQIPEEKMNELKWQRTQLLRRQREQALKKNPQSQAAKKPVQKVTQGPVKKVGPPKQVSKLATFDWIDTGQIETILGPPDRLCWVSICNEVWLMSTHPASKTSIRQIVHGRPFQSVICCRKTSPGGQPSQEEPPQRRALQDSRENTRKSGAKGERCCKMIGRSGNFA